MGSFGLEKGTWLSLEFDKNCFVWFGKDQAWFWSKKRFDNILVTRCNISLKMKAHFWPFGSSGISFFRSSPVKGASMYYFAEVVSKFSTYDYGFSCDFKFAEDKSSWRKRLCLSRSQWMTHFILRDNVSGEIWLVERARPAFFNLLGWLIISHYLLQR